MNNFKVIAFIGFSILFGLTQPSLGQDSLDPKVTVVPSSPDVASINKFTELPVGYYTGTPNISVPIIQLKCGLMNLPISLDYHASGLRVAEYSSWIGAGWTLKSGGVISRSIRGGTDERDLNDSRGFFYGETYFLNSDGTLNGTVLSDCSQSRQFTNIENTPDYVPLNPMDYIIAGLWDTEPDRYSFSIPGRSGKFVFNHKGEIIELTSDDIEIIHPFQNTISGNMYMTDYNWSITTPDGLYYLFNDVERTTNNTQCTSNSSEYISVPSYTNTNDQTAWYLSQMSDGLQSIYFNYENDTILENYTMSESQQVAIFGPLGNSTSNCLSGILRITPRLTNITTTNGYEIDFNASSFNRLDLSGSKKLESIVIKYLGVEVKTIELNNDSYFGTDTRLKLSEINILNSDNQSEEKYEFEYYSGSYPEHNSFSRDFWGFYNGANNQSLIPDYKTPDYHINASSNIDREPSLEHARVGVLKRMTYPTGGNLELDYELNDYYSEDSPKYYYQSVSVDGIDEWNPDSEEVEFTITQDCSLSILGDGITVDGDAHTYMKVYDQTQSTFVSFTPSPRPGPAPGSYGQRFDFPSGTYRIGGYSDGNPLTLEIEYEQFGQENFYPGPGLRIKKSSFFDPETAQTLHTIYDYTDTFGIAAKSTGILFSDPRLSEGYITSFMPGQEIQPGVCDDLQGDLTYFLNVADNLQLPQATSGGSLIGYSKVKVHKISSNELGNFQPISTMDYRPEYAGIETTDTGFGMEEYEFSNSADGINLSWPYVPAPDLDFSNGQLVKKKVYAFESGSLFLKEQIENEYDIISSDTLR
ncbi:MAG: hypothetical protein RIF46_11700, partial [Cyclobacteriaceae bacterium]